MEENEKLKQCPVCGGYVICGKYFLQSEKYKVICTDCGYSLRLDSYNEKDAILEWNRKIAEHER